MESEFLTYCRAQVQSRLRCQGVPSGDVGLIAEHACGRALARGYQLPADAEEVTALIDEVILVELTRRRAEAPLPRVLEAMVDTYWEEQRGYLCRVTARRLGIPESQRDDVVSDALASALQAIQLGKFRHEAGLQTWLYRILVNAAGQHARREKPGREQADTQLVETAVAKGAAPLWSPHRPDPEATMLLRESIERLKQRIQARVPAPAGCGGDAVMRVFHSRFEQGQQPEEVARALGIPKQTVYRLLERIRKVAGEWRADAGRDAAGKRVAAD